MFKKICIFALFVGLVFSSCDSPLLKSADNADGIEKLATKATVTGLNLCKFLEGKESCCSKETINNFQNATNDKIKNFTKDLGAADKQIETSLSSFVDLQEIGTEFLQLSAEIDNEIDTLDKSLTEEEQKQKRFLQRVMEEVSEIAKQAKVDAEKEVTAVKSKIKLMQKSRKTCVNHGMKVSAKMHCAACDASITFLADGKLKLKTDTCTNLQTNCKELLGVKTDDSNESPQMLKNSEFMQKYFEHKKKSFNESNTVLKKQKTLLKGLQSNATDQKANVKKALKIKDAGEGDITDLLRTGTDSNLDLDQAKAKLKAVLKLKMSTMINAGNDTEIDAMDLEKAQARHLEIKNANRAKLLEMMKKYARKADYSDRGYNLDNIDGLLYGAVNADISSQDLAGVQTTLKDINTKAQALFSAQMTANLDTADKIDAIVNLKTLVDQLKVLAEKKKEDALTSYQYIDFQILKGDGPALADLDLNTIKATAALLKSEREANYDEFKLTDGDVDGKSLAELKENIDKYALAFKANVENAIAQDLANKAALETYLENFSYTESDDEAALKTKVKAFNAGKDHAIDVPDFSSESDKAVIKARLEYQQTFIKTLMDNSLKVQKKELTNQQKINEILESVELEASEDKLKEKLIQIKALMTDDQKTLLGDVDKMTAVQIKEKLTQHLTQYNAHKVMQTVMDIDFKTMTEENVKNQYDVISSLLTEKDKKKLALGDKPQNATAIKEALEKWQTESKEQMMPNKQDKFGWGKGKTQARSKAAKLKVDDVFTKFSQFGSDDDKTKKEWSDSMTNFDNLNKDLDSKVALDTTQFKSMKVKKTKLPTGCSDADDCQALCESIITKKGIDIDALSRGGAVEEEVEGNIAAETMEGSDSEERLLSTGDVVFAEDGADVTSVVTDMTLDEVTENPGEIDVENPQVDDGTTNNTTNTTNTTNNTNVNNSNNTTNTTDPNISGLKMSVSLVLAAFALVALFWN